MTPRTGTGSPREASRCPRCFTLPRVVCCSRQPARPPAPGQPPTAPTPHRPEAPAARLKVCANASWLLEAPHQRGSRRLLPPSPVQPSRPPAKPALRGREERRLHECATALRRKVASGAVPHRPPRAPSRANAPTAGPPRVVTPRASILQPWKCSAARQAQT